MSQFLIAVFMAIVALAYYLCLLPQVDLLPDSLVIFGVLPAFVALHMALRHLIASSAVHVGLLVMSTALFTFYRSFSNGSPFLYVLIALHVLILGAVCLTVPLAKAIIEPVAAADNEGQGEDGK